MKNHSKSIICVNVICLIILVFSSLCYADDQNIFLIMTIDYPPYSFLLEDGKVGGFCSEILIETLNAMNIKNYEIQIVPWARGIRSLEVGKLNGLCPMQKSAKRETFTWFPEEPLLIAQYVFFIHKDNKDVLAYHSLDDLREKVIGIVRGFKYPEALWALKKKNNFDEVSKTEQNYRKLAAKRVDYVCDTYVTGMYYIRKLGLEKQIMVLPADAPIDSFNVYIGFSKKRVQQVFVKKFSEQIRELKSREAYHKRYELYYGVKK